MMPNSGIKKKRQDSITKENRRPLKKVIKSLFLLIIFLLGLSFVIATGGGSGGSTSGSSSGTVSGSGK
jgi:hypothetical protein